MASISLSNALVWGRGGVTGTNYRGRMFLNEEQSNKKDDNLEEGKV